MGADLWGVTWIIVEERYRAVCYLCDWRSAPTDDEDQAEPEMEAHLRSPEHERVLHGQR